MILYSVIPPEVVFSNPEEEGKRRTFEIIYRGERVEVTRIDGNRYIITRLLSTSPRAFLDPGFTPGTEIPGGLIV